MESEFGGKESNWSGQSWEVYSGACGAGLQVVVLAFSSQLQMSDCFRCGRDRGGGWWPAVLSIRRPMATEVLSQLLLQTFDFCSVSVVKAARRECAHLECAAKKPAGSGRLRNLVLSLSGGVQDSFTCLRFRRRALELAGRWPWLAFFSLR